MAPCAGAWRALARVQVPAHLVRVRPDRSGHWGSRNRFRCRGRRTRRRVDRLGQYLRGVLIHRIVRRAQPHHKPALRRSGGGRCPSGGADDTGPDLAGRLAGIAELDFVVRRAAGHAVGVERDGLLVEPGAGYGMKNSPMSEPSRTAALGLVASALAYSFWSSRPSTMRVSLATAGACPGVGASPAALLSSAEP